MKKTLSELGLLRIGVCAPELRVADVGFNTQAIVKAIDDAVLKECYFLLFPELCITGYTCADLFFQSALLNAVLKSLETIAEHTAKTHSTAIIGAPIADGGKIFNCAVFISDGKILGIIPKTYLPNYAEFYEERWFSSSRETTAKEINFKNEKIPFGTDILFKSLTKNLLKSQLLPTRHLPLHRSASASLLSVITPPNPPSRHQEYTTS